MALLKKAPPNVSPRSMKAGLSSLIYVYSRLHPANTLHNYVCSMYISCIPATGQNAVLLNFSFQLKVILGTSRVPSFLLALAFQGTITCYTWGCTTHRPIINSSIHQNIVFSSLARFIHMHSFRVSSAPLEQKSRRATVVTEISPKNNRNWSSWRVQTLKPSCNPTCGIKVGVAACITVSYKKKKKRREKDQDVFVSRPPALSHK